MEPEGGVVNVALLGLEVAGETSKRTIHLQASHLSPVKLKQKFA